jgi:hypothetical protein
MASAENAQIQYEGGQQSTPMSALNNSGDNMTYTSAATLWSQRSGFAAVVRPNGLLSGGTLSATGTNNQVAVTALSCNLQGVVTSVASGNVTITRPATAVAKVNSITVNASGALAVVAGTDSANTTFSETRGAAGGPPLIPVDSIEIGQVRVTSNTAAVLTAAQIFAVPGLHVERADGPLFEINYGAGSVLFQSALPLIHTGPAPKGVFASYAAPQFTAVARATDFVMPETSFSVTSTQIYGGTIGSTSSTLNQGSFTAFLNNGITDPLVQLKGETLWFRFYPDRYQAAYTLTQGKLGVSRTFPAADEIQASCTISASSAGVEVG